MSPLHLIKAMMPGDTWHIRQITTLPEFMGDFSSFFKIVFCFVVDWIVYCKWLKKIMKSCEKTIFWWFLLEQRRHVIATIRLKIYEPYIFGTAYFPVCADCIPCKIEQLLNIFWRPLVKPLSLKTSRQRWRQFSPSVRFKLPIQPIPFPQTEFY